MKLTLLKLTRLRRGLLQVEVAGRAGITRSRLSELENGHLEPRAGELERIAGVLGVALERLDEGTPSDSEPGRP